MNNRISFFNDQFVKEDDVRLHVADLSMQRGYGVFDFFRTIDHVPLFMNDYLQRFYRSAAGLHLPAAFDHDKLGSIINELIDQNKIASSGIRLMLTGGYSPDSYEIASPNFLITQQPLKPVPAGWENGIKVITHEFLRELPGIKSINYLTGVWLQKKVKSQGAADVLYYRDNIVSEFPRSNFFIVTKDDVIVTPADNILHGITRMKVLQLAARDHATEERIVTLDEAYKAKEAFLTSTTRQLIPVVRIDNNIIGNGNPGPVTQSLQKRFEEYCRAHIYNLT
ncbi:MAG TPA: aminotransferase class IV [Chitinophagaceae bacterium]|nr:aminotransferase class IV [Chitinophagaceae bacterium]